MQLISLKVYHDDIVIRELSFKNGINIITNAGEDGNQIGKSTALRAINFCLGSDGTSLWKDPDSGTINQQVYELLINGTVFFELVINIDNNIYTIKRIIEETTRKSKIVLKRISWINDKQIKSQSAFKIEIAKLFDYTCENPSFSTIKNRLFRLNKNTANGIYKYNNSFTSDAQYRLIYSYLFGFEGHNDLQKECINKNEINTLENRKNSLLNGNTEIEHKHKLEEIDHALSILYDKESSYDITGIQNETIAKIKASREYIACKSNEISQLETHILFNNRTIENYMSKVTDIDINVVKSIYEEATLLLPNVVKTFEETMNFHNSIFTKKAEYVHNQTKHLEQKLTELKANLNARLLEEKELVKNISNESCFGGFILIEKEIQDKKEERGRITYVLNEIKNIDTDIQSLNDENIIIREKIKEYLKEFETNLLVFNNLCKSISKEVFKSFSLYFSTKDSSDTSIHFSVINENLVSGDGAPRAASMAIDMAFVEYIKIQRAKMPSFTMQDYLEATDEDKLIRLINLANQRNIQTIISILNDKLSLLDSGFLANNTILELSKNDKFFKV